MGNNLDIQVNNLITSLKILTTKSSTWFMKTDSTSREFPVRLFSVYVPVSGGQNVILAAAVQSIGRAMFNIQITMVECNNLQESLHSQCYNQSQLSPLTPDLGSPSCGVQSYNKRSRRQFYLDLNSFGQQVSRRDRKRIARNKKTKNSPNRLPSYWRKIQKSELQLGLAGRIKKASSSQHPWVVKIMAASRLLCVGTAISRHYVLTSASCLVSRWEEEDISRQMKYLQLMETDSFISLYRIVLHHQWRLGQDLALVQTVTPLHHFLCLGTGALQDGLGAVQVGFKVNSSEKQSQSLFHQNISIPTSLPASLCPGSNCRTHSPDLSKWVSTPEDWTVDSVFLSRCLAVRWRRVQGAAQCLTWWVSSVTRTTSSVDHLQHSSGSTQSNASSGSPRSLQKIFVLTTFCERLI